MVMQRLFAHPPAAAAGDRCLSFSYTPDFLRAPRLGFRSHSSEFPSPAHSADPRVVSAGCGGFAYHFFRTFEGLTGTTPHQYLLRIRLRRAALRLRTEPTPILDVALDCGFGDVSNFNHAFRAEFGLSPRAYRSLAPFH